MKTLLPVWQRIAMMLVVGVSVSIAVLGMRAAGWLQAWELVAYDITTNALAGNDQTEDVVLLALTDADLSRWGWPLPDADLAQLIEASLSAGARTVGVDIYRDVPVGDGRDALLQVLQDTRVVSISKLAGPEDTEIAAPIDVRSGFADVPLDPDGVVRRTLLLVNSEAGISLSFPMQLAMIHTGQNELRPAPNAPQILVFGATAIPPLSATFGPYQNIDATGYQIMTQHRYALPIARRVTADQVLSGKASLQDKLLLIGLTSHSVKDYFSTPLNRRSGADFAFGADVHAANVQQLIDYDAGTLVPLSALSDVSESLLILLAACGGAVAGLTLRKTLGALTLGAIGALMITSGFASVQKSAILMPTVPATLAWIIAFAIVFVIMSAMARTQRRAMANIFSAHMSEALANDIWRQRKQLLAGQKPVSQRLFVTVLMADIEGSTRIGKAMETQAFMDWASRLLEALGCAAQARGGFVEKFTGDGILVVFGAPVPSATLDEHRRDARAAVACALDMRRAAHDLSAAHSDKPAYRLRIGLNSGEVIAGTLGPSGALRYNVMGDTVNIAARVEGWSKSLDPDETGFRPICLTASTAELIGEDQCRALDGHLLHDDECTRISIFAVA